MEATASKGEREDYGCVQDQETLQSSQTYPWHKSEEVRRNPPGTQE